ncbi:MAG: hypothetical protein ACM3SY_05515 [Candidatus Omnitrophota bacterium]
MSEELEVLKKLHRGTFQESELIQLYSQHHDQYRVLVSLLQQPGFPEKHAVGIIPKLFLMDLVRVIKNKHTSPGTRKRAEQEFMSKYARCPLGEKISYLKIAPDSLLSYFVDETDGRLLSVILQNPSFTEDLALRFIHRAANRFTLYTALCDTEWIKRPRVAETIAHDSKAPIRVLLLIIPFLSLNQLEKLYKDVNTHDAVKRQIAEYLAKKNSTLSGSQAHKINDSHDINEHRFDEE